MGYNGEVVRPYQRTCKNFSDTHNTVKWPTTRGYGPQLKKGLSNIFVQFTKAMGQVSLVNCTFFVMGVLLGGTELRGVLAPFVFIYLLTLQRERSSGLLFAITGSLLGAFTAFGYSSLMQMGFILAAIALIKKTHKLDRPILINSAFLVAYVGAFYLDWLFTGVGFFSGIQALFEGVLIVLGSYLLKPGIELIEEEGFSFPVMKQEQVISITVFIIMVVLGLQGLFVGSISISRLLSYFIVLCIGYYGGAGKGTILGLVLGISLSIYQLTQITIGALAVSGLFAGTFRDFGKFISSLAFLLSGSMMVFYLGEPFGLMPNLQELVLATLIFAVIPLKFIQRCQPLAVAVAPQVHQGNHHNQNQQQRFCQRLEQLSDLFEEMAQMFNPGKADKDQNTDVEDFVELACEKVCGDCSNLSYCWEQNFFETYKNFIDVMESFESTQGDDSKVGLPAYLEQNCIRPSLMLKKLQSTFHQHSLGSQKDTHHIEHQKFVSEQLTGVSAVIHNLSKEASLPSEQTGIREELHHYLVRKGFDCEQVKIKPRITGDFWVELVLNSCVSDPMCRGKIATAVSEIIGKKMSVLGGSCETGKQEGTCEVRLYPQKHFYVISGVAGFSKEGVSGDSFASHELSSGEHLLILSDGMGSGEKAKEDSQAAINLAVKLLDAGFKKNVVIRTVNALLSIKEPRESFVTLDIGLIDLYTGCGDFFKAGAFSSYIMGRHKDVTKIEGGTLPAGILSGVQPKTDTYQFRHGDHLFMISDGAYDPSTSDDWLQEAIREMEVDHPEIMAKELIGKIERRFYGNIPDDVTVFVSRIVSKSREVL